MANSINDISPEIRDSLLNNNLLLSDTILDNNLSGVATGLGLPSTISNLSNSILPSEDLELTAEAIRNRLISRNRYTSIEDMVSATIIDNTFSYDQQDGGYINENNELNFNGGGTEGLDIVDSIVSQEGFGLDSGGLYPQGDIRTTVTGRVLGGTGIINETPLGIIGGEQLLLALGQRASFNAQRELFGQVNLQPFSLISGSDFIVPDNSITIRSTTGGRILDVGLDIAGFTLPIDIIDDEASIENGDSEGRNNALIKYTGKGQLIRLFNNLNRNKYKPNYESEGSGRSKLGVNDPVTEYNATPSGITYQTLDSYNFGKTSEFGGIKKPDYTIKDFDGDTAIWDPSTIINDKESILAKTKEMFNDGVSYMIHFGQQGTPSVDFSQINTPSGKRLSRGSGVLSEDFLMNGDKENVFSRTWTSKDMYDSVDDLQKNSGLYNYKNKIRNDIEDSVLGENGFVKISPYNVPKGEDDTYDAKKFMFSIENLAWADNLNNLPKFEIGNGDPKTGTKGRVMWFPPYDIKFTDTTAIDWDTSKFIGRGEPLYTYNSTERSGTLSFKVIIDYPDYMNDSKITTNELMASLVAGSLDYNKYFSVNEERMLNNEINANQVEPKTTVATTPTLPDDFGFYFENDVSIINPLYETSGLNSTWNDGGFISTINDVLKQNKGIKIKIDGYASLTGTTSHNKVLSDNRIAATKTWFIDNLDPSLEISSRFNSGTSNGEEQSSATGSNDSKGVKEERVAKVQFVYVAGEDEQIKNTTEIKKEISSKDKEILEKVKRRFHREDEYFEELKKSDVQSDKIIYDNIREKIKFFHPAFHSTTPEGFNSRLTFLQQCTRQGATDVSNKSFNLAFGAPPVCILRVGDFYNTKIIMNTLAINYDPLVWDLNPEGVGVQPMIANVEINFKFIGGSALNGPINKLQNAVSFNYFANAGVYDPRADRFVRKEQIDPDNDFIFDYQEGEKNFGSKIDDEELNEPDNKQQSILGIANDQNVVAKIASEKLEEIPFDDKSEVANITIVSHAGYINDSDSLDLNFSYTHKTTSLHKLDSINSATITLNSSTNPYLNVVLGYITAKPNNSSSFIIEDNLGAQQQLISDNTGSTDFSITLNDFSIDVITSLNIINNEGGGTLKLSWSTGSKNNINF